MGIFDKLFKRGKSQTMFTSFGNSDLDIMYDGDGYIPLARNPDVIMAVNKIADMVSNMAVHIILNSTNLENFKHDNTANGKHRIW